MNIQSYIDSLLARGRYCFTAQQVTKALKLSPKAARATIWRARKRGLLASPAQGFYLILTPQYRILGCLPAEYFIDDLMQYWEKPYYVALLSAAQIHGAAHQKPQQFMVMTSIVHKPIVCGQVAIAFTKRKSTTQMPTNKIQTDFGFYKVSTPEVTAMDLVSYLHKCAGLDHVATVLVELSEAMQVKPLRDLTRKIKETVWMQRLGFLLEHLGKKQLADVLHQALRKRRYQPCALLAGAPHDNFILSKKWAVIINTNIEVDDV